MPRHPTLHTLTGRFPVKLAEGLTDSMMRDAIMMREINYHNTYSRWTVDCSRFGYIVDEDYYVINSVEQYAPTR